MAAYCFATDLRLTATERLIGTWIDRSVARGRDLCHSAEAIGRRVGRSARTVQLALAKLVRLGLLERFNDYKRLRSRRGYRLAFRGEPGLFPADPGPAVGAGTCAQSAQPPAPSPAVPPDPPMEVPEGKTRGEDVDVPPPAATTTTRPRVSRVGTGPDRGPLPPELAEAVREAEAHFGGPCAGKVRQAAALAREPEWVRRAVAAARRYGASSWGYVVSVLRDWAEGDGPPPERRRYTPEEIERKKAESRARRAAAEAAGGPRP
jgi:hypothetical protein